MESKVADFLLRETMCVLAIELLEGPHAAAMHFVFDPHTESVYFSTHNSTKKVTANFPARASLVVGFSEQDWVTVQMNGGIDKVTEAEAKTKILAKYPGDAKHFTTESIFLKFTPTWWRFTDFKAQPTVVLENK